MGPAYSVFTYDITKLSQLLCDGSHLGVCAVDKKSHPHYFESYFKELNAKTIVVETEYTDRDYLDDYSSYYVRCFTDYKRKCTRLHFFNSLFNQEEFKAVIEKPAPERIKELKNAYLGFIVVKPLPQTIIGRTCLKTYTEENGRRFPITREYEANLFGIPLSVKSLAYQEQDCVAAACATSALWSIFHGTGQLFHHFIPSPVEITKAATAHLPARTRIFPNIEGLSIEQMAHAIRHVGLEPYLVKVEHEYVLKSTVYAYAEAGLPLALGLILYDMTTGTPVRMGGHAVAVTGYRCDGIKPKSVHNSGFIPKASRIDRLYVHDDQVGPFARMEFDGKTIPLEVAKGVIQQVSSLSTSFPARNGSIGTVRAIPTEVLAPLYHKVRIRLESVETLVVDADAFLAPYISAGAIPLPERFEWEISLSSLNDLKTEILLRDDIPASTKHVVLTDSMPKFLWRARAFLQNTPTLELLFDATDIEQGRFFLKGITYDTGVLALLGRVLAQPAIVAKTDTLRSHKVFEWIRKPE